jgi:hypothetical protein
VRARNRRSRFVTRFTLFAAAAAISSTLVVPGSAPLAGPLLASVAQPQQAVLLAADPGSLLPVAGRRLPRAPHLARALASAGPSAVQAPARTTTLPVLLVAGTVLAAGLGRWLLEFVGKSSRTRGQPRMGELAL